MRIKFQPKIYGVNSGLDRVVVYFSDLYSVWNGVTSLSITPSSEESGAVYIDGTKNTILQGIQNFRSNITCLSFPEEVLDETFGLTFRVFTNVGRTEYDLHLVYGSIATLGSVGRTTTSNLPNPTGFQLTIESTPETTKEFGFGRLSHLVVSSKGLTSEALEAIENFLYGTDDTDPEFPTIDEVVELLESYASLRIINHGDGTWTAKELKPINAIFVDGEEFIIDWYTANFIETETFKIRSG